MRPVRTLPLAVVLLLASPLGHAASEYQCGAGKPNGATKKCDCPSGKVESTDNKGVSRCNDAPVAAPAKPKPPTCPSGMEFRAGTGCVPLVRTECPAGTTWTPGEGCVARVITRTVAPAAAGAALTSGQTVEFITDSGKADWSGEQDFKRTCSGACTRLSFFAGYSPNGAAPVVDKVAAGYFTTTAYPTLYAPVSAARAKGAPAAVTPNPAATFVPAPTAAAAPSARYKPGVRVVAIKAYEKIRVGMKGTYWGTNGKFPPAFVVWDEYIGAAGTYYRDEGAPAGRQDYGYWVTWDIIAPIPPQECGQTASTVNYGFVDVGTTLILGRHRLVNNDDNWSDEMAPYVGRRANVTKLVGVDKSGCPVVVVDADGGGHFWRIRDTSAP